MNEVKQFWNDFFHFDETVDNWWFRKRKSAKKRAATIVQIKGNGYVFRKLYYDQQTIYEYVVHLTFLIKEKDHFYIEEQSIPYELKQVGNEVISHKEIKKETIRTNTKQLFSFEEEQFEDKTETRFTYDRLAAVKYAERWWNSYNPEYKAFPVDCTNYVSQCLFAGSAPMYGTPNRDKGWWYENDNWSFSWAVAHSLRWYLSGSTHGLKGKEVSSAKELYPGDVICYDFEGDNKWDHTTIVVAKDSDGMPLVNAHTNNSRHRYWTYEDSAAWTPDIQYKFFKIG